MSRDICNFALIRSVRRERIQLMHGYLLAKKSMLVEAIAVGSVLS
jgi:hypothetical protein